MSGQRPRPECAHAPEVWFSERQDDIRYAKSICLEACPVQPQCLRLALEHEGGMPARSRYGVWGGYSPTERASMSRCGARPAASGDPPDVAA